MISDVTGVHYICFGRKNTGVLFIYVYGMNLVQVSVNKE